MPIHRPIIAPLYPPVLGAMGGRLPWEGPGGGGAAPWSPLALGSKVKLWLDERGQTLATGISPWADNSPAPVGAFSQATGSAQPTQVTFAGYPSPSFAGPAGGLQYLQSASAMSAVMSAIAHQAFAFAKWPTVAPVSTNVIEQACLFASETDGEIAVGARDAGAGLYEVALQLDSGGFKKIVAPGLVLDTGTLIEWGHYGGSMLLRRNDDDAITPVLCGPIGAISGLMRIGANYNGSVYARLVTGEVLITTPLTAAEVQQVRAYIARKRGATARAAQSLGNVLLIDNSIGVGYTSGATVGTGGFRLLTEQIWNSLGIANTWVGSQTTGGGHHEAYSGVRLSSFLATFAALIATNAATTVIIGAPENDLGLGDGTAAALTTVNALIDIAQAAGIANSRIFVRQPVVPTAPHAYFANAADFTSYRAALPGECTAQGVTPIAFPAAPTLTDGLHPVDAFEGYPTCTNPVAEVGRLAVEA